jgi:hypothetical protein
MSTSIVNLQNPFYDAGNLYVETLDNFVSIYTPPFGYDQLCDILGTYFNSIGNNNRFGELKYKGITAVAVNVGYDYLNNPFVDHDDLGIDYATELTLLSPMTFDETVSRLLSIQKALLSNNQIEPDTRKASLLAVAIGLSAAQYWNDQANNAALPWYPYLPAGVFRSIWTISAMRGVLNNFSDEIIENAVIGASTSSILSVLT